jgi:predicted acetyltransferase
MPQIKVRPYEERDREAFFHVRAMTYNNGRPIPPEDQVFKTTRGYVGEVDGKVVGVFSVLDFTCTRGAAIFSDAAVAGVAVLPEYRMTGVGGAMMRDALTLFREEGIPMASLYAFRESYYRRFGYEVCGSRVKITVPNGRYPKIAPTLPISRISQADAHILRPCYEAFCRSRSGMNVRTEMHWSRVLSDDIAIYVAGDPAEAYLLINHQWQFWEGQAAAEVVWNTRQGYEAILSVLTGIGINKSSIEWYEPSDSPYLALYVDQGVKASFERYVMYRVTDVPSCLKGLKTEASGSFSISVPDELIPDNAGPWHIDFSPSGIQVQPTHTADIEIPIRHFVQAVLGEPSLSDLVKHGIIGSNNRKALATAEALLPPNATYCTDFF